MLLQKLQNDSDRFLSREIFGVLISGFAGGFLFLLAMIVGKP